MGGWVWGGQESWGGWGRVTAKRQEIQGAVESRSVPGTVVSGEMGTLGGRKFSFSHEQFLRQPGGEKQTPRGTD